VISSTDCHQVWFWSYSISLLFIKKSRVVEEMHV